MAVKTAFSIKRVILLATSVTVLGGMVSAPAAEAMVTTYQSQRAGRLLGYDWGDCAINAYGARALAMGVTEVGPAKYGQTTFEKLYARMLVDRWDGQRWYRYYTSPRMRATTHMSSYFRTPQMGVDVGRSGYYRVGIEYQWYEAANGSFLGSVVDYYERGDFRIGGGTWLGNTSAGTPGFCYMP